MISELFLSLLLPQGAPHFCCLNASERWRWWISDTALLSTVLRAVVFWMDCAALLLSSASPRSKGSPSSSQHRSAATSASSLTLMFSRAQTPGLALPLYAWLGQLWLWVQQDAAELFQLHGTLCLRLPQAVLQTSLQSKDWTICLRSMAITSAAPMPVAWEVTAVVFLSVCHKPGTES